MNKIISWLALIRAKGVGCVKFWKLINEFGDSESAIKYAKVEVDYREAENIYKKYCNNIIIADDIYYPKRLKILDNRPPILFYKGDKDILLQDSVGIIGARNSSINGNSIAYNMAKNLAPHFSVVSGMARGIDSSVHKGSLTSHKKTVTVLPLGIENIYPSENKMLYHEIESNGVIISEHIDYHGSDPGVFYARNRIVAGMCKAIVVIEAANKSGTIQTANLAIDIGCDVLVVPGSPLDPRSHGGNYLIKNGAPLVENHFDVLDIIGANYNISNNKHVVTESDSFDLRKNHEEKILSLLDTNPISVEFLAFQSGMPVNEILQIISILEIRGKIVKHNMNMISKIKS